MWSVLALPMSLGMAEKCSVPAVTDLMFSQFLHKSHLSWSNGCCTGSFRCADIVYPEYASKGLKYLLRAVWMDCPHHTEVVHSSSSPHIIQVSLLNSEEAIPGRRLDSGKCLPLPLSLWKEAAGMGTVLWKAGDPLSSQINEVSGCVDGTKFLPDLSH